MQTDRIRVASDGSGREQALREAEKFAQYVGLGPREGLRLRLLTEETLGMVTAITQQFDADFWIESTAGRLCRLHLKAKTDMNYTKKKELMAVSSSGRNEAAKGFMGKIRELIENAVYSSDEEFEQLAADPKMGPMLYASMGMGDSDLMAGESMLYLWSLERYRAAIEAEQEKTEETPAAEAAWDELEKSIVASIADDVRVSVSGKSVELIIEKQLPAEE